MGLKESVKQKPTDHIRKTIRDARDFLCGHFVEREGVADLIFYAILNKQHVLFYGDPGTAKTAMFRALLSCFDNSTRTFKMTMSKYLPEEAVIGPLNPKKLRDDGLYEHNTSGTLVDCHLAYLDEIFDANDATLRSMLEILNERTFTKGHQFQKSPLMSAFMSSNFMRTEKNIAAFVDRIVFRANVSYLKNRDSRRKMLRNFINGGENAAFEGTKLSLEDIHCAQEAIKKITISDGVLKTYEEIVTETGVQLKRPVSDRKYNQMIRVIQTSAFLNGRTEANVEDLRALRFCLVVVGDINETNLFDTVYAKKAVKSVEIAAKYGVLKNKTEKLLDELSGKKVSELSDRDVERLSELGEELESFQHKSLGDNSVDSEMASEYKHEVDQLFIRVNEFMEDVTEGKSKSGTSKSAVGL